MTLLNPWVWLGILAALGAAFLAGVKVESDHRDAQLLVQERVYHETYVARAATLRGNADEVSGQLNNEQAERDADREEYSQKLLEAIHAQTLGKCEADPAGKPGAAPTIFVSVELWNDALKIGGAASGDPGRADGEAAGADFAPLAEAYSNLGENSARWDNCRSQVKGWQALAVKNGWVKSAEHSP